MNWFTFTLLFSSVIAIKYNRADAATDIIHKIIQAMNNTICYKKDNQSYSAKIFNTSSIKNRKTFFDKLNDGETLSQQIGIINNGNKIKGRNKRAIPVAAGVASAASVAAGALVDYGISKISNKKKAKTPSINRKYQNDPSLIKNRNSYVFDLDNIGYINKDNVNIYQINSNNIDYNQLKSGVIYINEKGVVMSKESIENSTIVRDKMQGRTLRWLGKITNVDFTPVFSRYGILDNATLLYDEMVRHCLLVKSTSLEKERQCDADVEYLFDTWKEFRVTLYEYSEKLKNWYSPIVKIDFEPSLSKLTITEILKSMDDFCFSKFQMEQRSKFFYSVCKSEINRLSVLNNLNSTRPAYQVTTIASTTTQTNKYYIGDLFNKYNSENYENIDNDEHNDNLDGDDHADVELRAQIDQVAQNDAMNKQPIYNSKVLLNKHTMNHLQKMLTNLAGATVDNKGQLVIDYSPFDGLPTNPVCANLEEYVHIIISFLQRNLGYVQYDPDVVALVNKLVSLSDSKRIVSTVSNVHNKDKSTILRSNITKLIDYDFESFVLIFEYTILPENMPVLYKYYKPSLVNMALYNLGLMIFDCAHLTLNKYVKESEAIEIVNTGDLIRYIYTLPEYVRFILYTLILAILVIAMFFSNRYMHIITNISTIFNRMGMISRHSRNGCNTEVSAPLSEGREMRLYPIIEERVNPGRLVV
jgi:hypothetical protein